jgi:hypothetical protein
MTKQEIMQKFPKTYNEILQEGILQERKEAQAKIESEAKAAKAFDFKI